MGIPVPHERCWLPFTAGLPKAWRRQTLRGHGHCLMKLGRHDASFDRIGLNFAHEALVGIYLCSSFKLWRSHRVSGYRSGLLDRFKSPPDGSEAFVTPI